MFHFDIFLKNTKQILTFSGGTEMGYWAKMTSIRDVNQIMSDQVVVVIYHDG